VQDVQARFREQIAFAIDPDDLLGSHFQILPVAAQIVNDSNISGGLSLVRGES
jgi:hypothetical protein